MDNILILADNDFAKKEETVIQIAKIITKDQEHLTFLYYLKFNKTQIKLNLEGIILTKESHIGDILLITNHDVDSTSLRRITSKKISSKE